MAKRIDRERTGTDRERIANLARRQAGLVASAQLAHLGIAPATIHTWVAGGYLLRALPRVYAIGHMAPSREARLWAAVLYAGPGAMLSHGTQAHWRGLIDHPPREIHVSTPRAVRSLPGVRVHGRRTGLVRETHRGVPVTGLPVMMVDLAATHGPSVVQRALGQLDFQRLLDVDTLLGACGRGTPGAARLRAAIEAYDPRRKYANGALERAFLDLCERRGLPLPILNTHIDEIRVDAYWPGPGLVVELDGQANHSSPAQRRRDRRNDLTLRGHGLSVHRYDWELVHDRPAEVARDVVAALTRLMAARPGPPA